MLPLRCSLLLALWACQPAPRSTVPAGQALDQGLQPAASYGDQYLLVISASPQEGAQPPALNSIAAHPELGLSPFRLSSSQFRNLKPCLELLVAGAYPTLDEAQALSKGLKKLKLDHDVVPVGPYVGPQAAIEAYCAETHATTKGPALHFVELHEGAAYLALAPDQAQLERALQAAPAPTPLGSLSVWSAPLDQERLGPHAKGEPFTLFDPFSGAQAEASLGSFVALTRGTPHHHYSRLRKTPTVPGCGEPGIWARLQAQALPEIKAGAPLLARPPGSALTVGILQEEADEQLRGIVGQLLRTDPLLEQAFADLRDVNRQAQRKMRRGTRVQRYALGEGRQVLVADVIFHTGEPDIHCQASDIKRVFVAAWTYEDGQPGAVLIPPMELPGSELGTALDLEGDGVPEILAQHWTGGWLLLDASGELVAELARPYCDCPC